MGKIIDGKLLASVEEEGLKKRLINTAKKPLIYSILIGEDPASVLYTNRKQAKAAELGINFQPLKFSEDISFEEVSAKIKELNEDLEVTGIMIQLPIPKKVLGTHSKFDLLELIDPKKDIDGLNPKGDIFMSATVKGVIKILESVLLSEAAASEKCLHEMGNTPGVLAPLGEKNLLRMQGISDELRDSSALPQNDSEKQDSGQARMTEWWKKEVFAVVGSEGEVGKPLVKALIKKGAEQIIGVDKKNPESSLEDIKEADVVVSCTGVQGLIKAEMIKEGVVLIDVGMGDFHEDTYKKSSYYTPKFGGVGPMTILSLTENILEAAQMIN